MNPNPALRDVEHTEGVAILLAVESGSRAWGFPSPDSDWDVRFIYARPTAWHLRVSPGRDVIERTLPDDLDLAGWDMRKTLGLNLRGNCTIREWLASPLRYRGEPDFVAALIAVMDRVPDRLAALHHYASLASKVQHRWLERPEINYKKYLYAVRPALVLRWMRMNPAGAWPMHVPPLLAGASLTAEQTTALDRLLAIKAATSEVGTGDAIPVLSHLITDELALAREAMRTQPATEPDAMTRTMADELLAASAAFADRVVAMG